MKTKMEIEPYVRSNEYPLSFEFRDQRMCDVKEYLLSNPEAEYKLMIEDDMVFLGLAFDNEFMSIYECKILRASFADLPEQQDIFTDELVALLGEN